MANTTSTAWYRQGTVSVADESTTVTGHATRFLLAGINQGATFRIDGKASAYEIASVVSDTEIKLAKPYDGETVSNAAYSIDRNFQSTLPAELSARLAMALGEWELRYDTDMMTITGKSAYEVAKENGYTGTVTQWLESLKGKTAFELAVKNGFTGTEAEWLESLKAAQEWSALNDRTNILTYHNAAAHNAIYRGKNLGATITAEQSAAIRNGNFKDLYPGDFWSSPIPAYSWTDSEGTVHEEAALANPVTWLIMGCNSFKLKPDNAHNITGNHLVVIPHGGLLVGRMNNTESTDGGYANSEAFKNIIPRCEAMIKAVFGEEHILPHYDYLCNAVTDGIETGHAYYSDRLCDIPSGEMVFGFSVRNRANITDGAGSQIQFPAFALLPDLTIAGGIHAWLRDAGNDTSYMCICSRGGYTSLIANHETYAKFIPFFLLY